MAFSPFSSCWHCSSSPSLLQPASPSRGAPISQSALNHQTHICPHLRSFSTIPSGGLSLNSSSKTFPVVNAHLPTFASIHSTGNSRAGFLWVSSFSRTIAGNRSSSSPACGISNHNRTPFYSAKRRSSVARLKASQETEGSTTDSELEPEVGDKKESDEELTAGREATAAVTVAVIASDAEAASRVLETLDKQQDAIGVDDTAAAAKSFISEELEAIYAKCQRWPWKNKYSINYMVQGSGPPVVLVHGFGASIGHWRRNIGVLSKTNTVYAIDLLGLGASEKPSKFAYTMEAWAELLIDFLKEIVGSSAVLVGNSIGSLACLIASAEAPEGLVRGTVLLNCAGGMNNKAVADDWRLKLALPLLWLIDFLLNRPSIAAQLFKRVRSRANIKNVLQSIYNNKAAVDEELIEVILKPSDTPGALEAFVSIITGPPGPKPQTLMPKISTPVLLIWGDDDPFTPINGPVGKYFTALATTAPNVQLYLLPNVGHCPHDDKPDLVHWKLVPWLASLPA